MNRVPSYVLLASLSDAQRRDLIAPPSNVQRARHAVRRREFAYCVFSVRSLDLSARIAVESPKIKTKFNP